MHESPEKGKQGLDIPWWEGNSMEGGVGLAGEEGPEARPEDPEVNGAYRLGIGVYQRLGGLGVSGPTSTSQSADDDEGLRGTGRGDGGPVYLET